MALSKNTDLGQITISDQIFAGMLIEAIRCPECEGRVWPSTKRGRIIPESGRSYESEVAGSIEVSRDDADDTLYLNVYVVIKFGAGIKKVVEAMCSYMAGIITERQGERKVSVMVHVTGVKSKQVARRELLVIKEYGRDEY